MKREFWTNKKVLLTGHTGFKGSWLSIWLQKLGAEVIGFSLAPPTSPNLFEITEIASKITSISGDIRDLDHLSSVIKQFKPEIVIHMAAQALVRPSYDDPVETYSSNVMGTVNVLEAIRLHGIGSVKATLVITSDKCYENQEWYWGYRENERMGGRDPYSNSKGCAELVTTAYRDSFFSIDNFNSHGVAIASARAGNVIGGGDWAKDRLIPDIIKAFEKSKPVEIRNPKAIRPWQHVLEPLSGYMDLCENLYENPERFTGGWNFGPEDESARNVSSIVEHMANIWGEGAKWEVDSGEHVHEANYLKLDCSKAKALLGFKPRMDVMGALEWVVNWYKAHNSGEDMLKYTISQIELFESLN